ncbi:MAG: DUF3662 domain-containing protein [Acidimicrobiales bacterium]|nr:DUF3662 domain-containing protein [Acidimicrobiales bacterium]
MLYVVAFVVAAGVGFALSRLLRTPTHAAQAAAVARNVGGSLGGRRGLDAPELQRACFSEMVRHVRVSRDGRMSVPGSYLLHLNPGDVAVVDESRRWFSDGLVQALRDASAQNGWRLHEPVDIDFEADATRRPGAPLAVPGGSDRDTDTDADDARAARSGAPAPSAERTSVASSRSTRRNASRPAEPALGLIRTDTGATVPLEATAVTVGRSPDNTIASPDERISRKHARLEPIGGGWVVIDLSSANGTRVDGGRIRSGTPIPVTPGTTIAVGPLELHVVDLNARSGNGAAASGAPASGTRALDRAERNRISQEVLGLPGADRRR